MIAQLIKGRWPKHWPGKRSKWPSGETPAEGEVISKVLEVKRQAIATADHEQRMIEIENFAECILFHDDKIGVTWTEFIDIYRATYPDLVKRLAVQTIRIVCFDLSSASDTLSVSSLPCLRRLEGWCAE